MMSFIVVDALKYTFPWEQPMQEWLTNLGFSGTWASVLTAITWFGFLLIIAIGLYHLVQYVVRKILEKTNNRFDDVFVSTRFVKRICYFIPLSIIDSQYSDVLADFPKLLAILDKVIALLYLVLFVAVINAFLNALVELYQQPGAQRSKPVKTFVQFTQIIVIFVGIIIAISILTNKSPSTLMVGLGAMSAVLMLIFKDSILGLVAGFQLSANNMVMLGDWIEMPKYNADGEVIDITLTTVKVQNWDKTISTIPTYSLISDSVKNWRGMQESGGRRIARSIFIDMQSVHFCSDALIAHLKKLSLISEYVTTTQDAIDVRNQHFGFDMTVPGNGSRQTNLGIFRAYLTAYLKNLPELNQDMALMVRQLAPTEKGIPIQLYCFTKDTAWVPYEKVQSDIFEHLLGILPIFELRVFQTISDAKV